MACGSVFATETQLGRDLSSLDLPRKDLKPDRNRQRRNSPSKNATTSYRVGGNAHEAIRFLQAEHEAVLSGLHLQIKQLQKRCDDLQFEAHLRHVTLTEEDTWRAKVAELNRLLEERTSRVKQLEEQLAEQQKLHEDEHEQNRWRELQLQQQLEAGERRVSDLKGEVARLRAQVKDLRVYSTALRTVRSRAPSNRASNNRSSTAVTTTTTGARPPSRNSRSSVGSLDSLESSGPKSLGSEDGEAGSWRGARLGGGASTIPSRLQRSLGGGGGARGIKGPQSPTRRSSTFSLPPTQASPPSSMPPLASLQPQRPSSSVTLPPISMTQSVARHVRKQLRLGSAPALDIDRSENKTSRDPA
ncbi:LOW QUALITY PROTEIN: EF-hand and coiled-coil domain-containing protein 1-like [Macrobrachium rosenbergii]|uniref:LOW QUALITY PROTEIN: EF-hand and coiled-coil domain-containing protein 1-like n=1 Tax=Macrobrachium rosenbergii TaxID=79674 RepID=UPI0034D56FD8